MVFVRSLTKHVSHYIAISSYKVLDGFLSLACSIECDNILAFAATVL